MEDLKGYLQSLDARDALIGIGNALRGDDGFGPELVARLGANARCLALDGGEMPEDHAAFLLERKPRRILFVDAVAFGGQPGELVLLEPGELGKKVAISTHTLPLAMLIKQLQEKLPQSDIRILGVQPKQIGLGKGVSPEVAKTVAALAELLAK